MKNIFLLIVFCFTLGFSLEAQNKTLDLAADKTLVTATNFYASDTIAAGRTSYTIQVDAAKQSRTVQAMFLKLDSISGPRMSVQLKGSRFGTDWTNIGSAVVWYGTASATNDTTIIISNTTPNDYSKYRVTVTRVAGKARVKEFRLKQMY